MQTSPRGSPLRSDGVDGTGDANQTRVLVANRTTGRGGQATLGSIQTHSPRRLNSRRVVKAEQEVKQIPDGMVLRRDNQWDIPRKRALFISDGPDSTTSGSDILEDHYDRPPEVEYSDIVISGRPQDESGTEGLCSPSRQLDIAVVRLQKDIDDYRAELELTRTQTLAVVGFTSTPVPRFSGKSNWEQYRQVFESIVCSNGWDDVTAALQLLSHLDGDALNVALLVPESRRVVLGFLIKSLSDHYSSPGRLAEYKRQFQRALRRPGDDPSIFAIELEMLARRAFIDIDPLIQLQMVRDRFIGVCTPQTLGQFGT